MLLEPVRPRRQKDDALFKQYCGLVLETGQGYARVFL